ncbi:hypothetical protein SMITH_598 [Smithella sp. ME-1]|uniref:DUF1844 domain-containing protein n=1 Tax=hydrocarbon metagenome TaxID=938273 RepID=A0A0W8FRV8_9ZZZZ|nr:hypothetical protein SMITH_598 [Smithella sp. ME-1]
MEEEKKDSGFVVKDKRLFDEEGKERSQEEKLSSAPEETSQAGKDSPNEQKQEHDYPQVNFTNFVLSLSTSALFHFGDFPEYEGGKAEKNLPAAKQTIDILDMLNEKTKGNLDKNESSLIQGVLYELKMRYVKEKA